MPFRPEPEGMNYARLKASLANSRIQVENNALYQTIFELINGAVFFKEKIQELNKDFIERESNTVKIPSLTNGSVIFQGPQNFSQDNANFFWDNINKRLGIGNNTPATSLHIRNSTGLGLTIEQNGTGNSGFNLIRTGGTASDWIIYLKPGTTSVAFYNGSDRLVLDAGGLITASSLTLTNVITIGTNPASAGLIRIPNNTNGIEARNAANTADVGVFTVDASDNLILGFASVADVIFKPANTEQARIVAGAGVRSIASGAFYWNGRAVMLSPADAMITFTNIAQTSGFGLQMGTADTMIVANQAQSAYGTVDALAYKVSATPGIDASITTATLVGKTITVNKGIITGFA